MAEQINYYEVLGVSREASQAQIRNAYRNLAKERHPDHPGGSADEFARLQEANAVLSDPNRRRQHDEALDLAHAADELAGLDLDFGSVEDELSTKRRERESEGPSLGERLRSRYDISEARWYEPHRFDPEPVSLKSGAITFVAAFLAFIAIGQIGLWATGASEPGIFVFLSVLAPFMPVLYSLVGLVVAYFAFRTAGYAALALAFVAALVVGGQGPTGLLQFVTVGIIILLVVVYLGNRRESAARR